MLAINLKRIYLEDKKIKNLIPEKTWKRIADRTSDVFAEEIKRNALDARYPASPRARRYSERYARRKGVPRAPVDLYGRNSRATHMVDAIKPWGRVTPVRKIVRAGIKFTTRRAAKLARLHETGGKYLPQRNFLFISQRLIRQIVKTIKDSL